jgi:hypothetical protein
VADKNTSVYLSLFAQKKLTMSYYIETISSDEGDFGDILSESSMSATYSGLPEHTSIFDD